METEEIINILSSIRDYELNFSTSRSGGPGGQHVNKVNTKVEVRFNIRASAFLSHDQKEKLLLKLGNKVTQEGELIVTSQATRSQLENKEKAVDKILNTLRKALTPPKKRKPTQPTKASKQKRLNEKKIIAEKKESRKPPEI